LANIQENFQERIEGTSGVTKRTDTTMFKQKKGQILQCSNRKKDRYYNVQTEKRTDTTMFKQKKGQILQCSNRKRDKNTMIYDTLYRKLMIEQHEPRKITGGMNTSALEGYAVPAP
jgi:hypothetical protein